MNGYFSGGRIGEEGTLHIDVTNITAFKALILKAKEEANQLNNTINQLQNFQLDIVLKAGDQDSLR